MTTQELIDFLEKRASDFGAVSDHGSSAKSYVLRNNAKSGPSDENKAYVGLVQPDETNSGPYHDFSFTVMPGPSEKASLVSICVGSLGFKNDFDLASRPGLRRLFAKLVTKDGVLKSDFSDIESPLPTSFVKRAHLSHLSKTLKTYSSVLAVCQVVPNLESDEGKAIISRLLAAYASVRGWRHNAANDRAIEEALKVDQPEVLTNEADEITELLKARRFVVLQGAPGTGKTRAAKIVAKQLPATTVFTQFHAETSYSDFIYGIRPGLNENKVGYRSHEGTLTEAIQLAEKSDGNVVLIIDEINRANLSNVLGPVFYLFEPRLEDTSVEIQLFPGKSVSRLPENLFVIATMNTADRSLAVVDFALRRRFAWYTLKPKTLKGLTNGTFYENDFAEFERIFHWYGSSDELSLQPGHGYFIAGTEEEMNSRVRYELLPLIQEYLREGLMRPAKEDFNEYFLNRIGVPIFE